MKISTEFIREDAQFTAPDDTREVGQQLILDLTGGPYLIRGLSISQKEAIYRHFGESASDSNPATKVQTTSTTTLTPSPEDNFLHPEFEIYEFSINPEKHRVLCAGLCFYAQIELEPTISGVLWTPAEFEERDFIELVLKNYLRVLIVYSLFKSGGIMLHSSGVLDQQAAHIFFGHSGDGKTTICHLGLESGRDCLSDDLNALFLNNGRLYAERIPFSGVFAQQSISGRYPVTALYHLEKSTINHILPSGGALFFAKMLSNAPFINKDPYRLGELSERITEMIKHTQQYKLCFKPDADIWNLIQQHASLPYE